MTSDFICPWCLVGEARLNQAIKRLNLDIKIHRDWSPFELNPDMPEAGMDRRAYRSHKFGSWAYSQQLDAQTVQATQLDDVEFRYDLMAFTPNTLKAHRLTWLASKKGRATEMAERIFRGYFTEGQDIGSVETLTNLAAEVGLDSEEVRAFLSSDEGIQAVRALERQAIARNIRSVPTICIGNEVLSGAQPVEKLLVALQKAAHSLEMTG